MGLREPRFTHLEVLICLCFTTMTPDKCMALKLAEAQRLGVGGGGIQQVVPTAPGRGPGSGPR